MMMHYMLEFSLTLRYVHMCVCIDGHKHVKPRFSGSVSVFKFRSKFKFSILNFNVLKLFKNLEIFPKM